MHSLLLIEDNPYHAELMTELLNTHCAPITLHTVDSIEGAVHQLGEYSYDLILTDSVVRGKQIKHDIGLLKDLGKGAPILVVTGAGNERVAVELMRLGVVEYVTKTRETLEQLPRTIQRYLSKPRTSGVSYPRPDKTL